MATRRRFPIRGSKKYIAPAPKMAPVQNALVLSMTESPCFARNPPSPTRPARRQRSKLHTQVVYAVPRLSAKCPVPRGTEVAAIRTNENGRFTWNRQSADNEPFHVELSA